MDKVITKGSSLQCQHSGTITPVATAVSGVLSVDGNSVLIDTLVNSTVGTDCTQQTNTQTGSKQCSTVQTESPGGASTVLNAGGKAVLLASDKGATDGLPTFDWSVTDAKQTVLYAD